MAQESAENIQKLKSCWDAGDSACVAETRSRIELDENAYTDEFLKKTWPLTLRSPASTDINMFIFYSQWLIRIDRLQQGHHHAH